MSPSEFAKRINVTVGTVRRWDNTGELTSDKNAKGHRAYTEAHVSIAIEKGLVKRPHWLPQAAVNKVCLSIFKESRYVRGWAYHQHGRILSEPVEIITAVQEFLITAASHPPMLYELRGESTHFSTIANLETDEDLAAAALNLSQHKLSDRAIHRITDLAARIARQLADLTPTQRTALFTKLLSPEDIKNLSAP